MFVDLEEVQTRNRLARLDHGDDPGGGDVEEDDKDS